MLVAGGADSTCRHEDGGSLPIHFAAQEACLDILQWFVEERNVSAVVQNNDGETPLDFAVTSENAGAKQVVNYLLSKVAQEDSALMHLNQALCAAINYGYGNMIPLLLENGANSNDINSSNEPILYMAVKTAVNKRYRVAVTTFGNGAFEKAGYQQMNVEDRPDTKWRAGEKVEIISENQKYIDVVRILLENGADSNIVYEGKSLLHLAVQKEYVDLVRLLLDYGTDINAKNSDGNTPLHLAAEQGNLDIARLLLEKNANSKIYNTTGHTALRLAQVQHEKDVAQNLKWTHLSLVMLLSLH